VPVLPVLLPAQAPAHLASPTVQQALRPEPVR
jgi:hypothetical protein